MKKNNQKGTILLTTLLLLTVVTLIAVGMAERSQIDIKRTAQLLTAQQAYLYAKPAEIWAAQQLKASLLAPPDMPLDMPLMNVPGGIINARLVDAQGEFFNLNNLSDLSFRPGFKHLLPDSKDNDFLMRAIISWISPLGQETDALSDQYYLALSPPYRAAHQLFASPSELRLIKGITAEIYNTLIPYMIALPEKTLININTASAVVLSSLSETLSLNDAAAIVDQRRQKGGFKSVSDFLALPLVAKYNLPSENITVESHYFLLKTTITLHHQVLTVFTLLKKPAKDKDAEILWQTRGSL